MLIIKAALGITVLSMSANTIAIILILTMTCEDCCIVKYDGECVYIPSRCNLTYDCGKAELGGAGCACKISECEYEVYHENCNSYNINRNNDLFAYRRYCECKPFLVPYYIMLGLFIPTCLGSLLILAKKRHNITVPQFELP